MGWNTTSISGIPYLRNDPSTDAIARPWAANIGIQFGRVAMRHGVVVLNDPDGLSRASSKMYFQLFPEEVRPHTLITRDRDEIKAFAREVGTIVIKPLQGAGGASVFLVRPDDIPNLNQMIDAVSGDGYVIAQEYLTAAEKGDLRLFLLNGQPLRYNLKASFLNPEFLVIADGSRDWVSPFSSRN